MVQTEDHGMRSECAKEFGSIHTSLAFHKEWRAEQVRQLNRIQLEIEKLTGNGNRGKMDELSSKIGDLSTMLVAHIASCDASQHRIESLENRTKDLEERIFSTALKVAGAVGMMTMLLSYLGNRFFG